MHVCVWGRHAAMERGAPRFLQPLGHGARRLRQQDHLEVLYILIRNRVNRHTKSRITQNTGGLESTGSVHFCSRPGGRPVPAWDSGRPTIPMLGSRCPPGRPRADHRHRRAPWPEPPGELSGVLLFTGKWLKAKPSRHGGKDVSPEATKASERTSRGAPQEAASGVRGALCLRLALFSLRKGRLGHTTSGAPSHVTSRRTCPGVGGGARGPTGQAEGVTSSPEASRGRRWPPDPAAEVPD